MSGPAHCIHYAFRKMRLSLIVFFFFYLFLLLISIQLSCYSSLLNSFHISLSLHFLSLSSLQIHTYNPLPPLCLSVCVKLPLSHSLLPFLVLRHTDSITSQLFVCFSPLSTPFTIPQRFSFYHSFSLFFLSASLFSLSAFHLSLPPLSLYMYILSCFFNIIPLFDADLLSICLSLFLSLSLFFLLFFICLTPKTLSFLRSDSLFFCAVRSSCLSFCRPRRSTFLLFL